MPLFAKAVHADPAHELRLAMLEYAPDTLEVIEEHFGLLLSENEKRILEIIREASDHLDPNPVRPSEIEALQAWARSLVE